MINVRILVLKYLIFLFLVEIFLSPSYGVYISQLIHFERVCSYVDDFNNRNIFLTSLLSNLYKVIHTINFVKLFLNFITDTQS